ncbi:uncharacterized protein LOC131314774 [Rhododendron vialii]|uniref:uncharacterized protein LOC131314774 n=1 Tax=Rhododendron vialii TaxID=182163 RepID=UPI0026600C8B|nr:uncharacterized protein LOC131314774 [Rhododendron vialii]XP_058199603.1 uncharacterized protein LOC131314774 [Rhododendron vialii]
MDVSVQYFGPMKQDLTSPNDWGPLWRNCKKGSGNVGSLVAELGIALEDALVLLSTSATPLGKEEEFEDLINDRDESVTGTPQNNLGKHVGMPCSRNEHLSHLPVSGEDKISNNASDGLSSSEPGNPNCTSIISLPVVSSMRGSREKRGLHVENLSVRWAPDVYDPTPTSQSHTVKRYNGPKMSKKSNRHKHKGKSPRSNIVDKKHRRKSS